MDLQRPRKAFVGLVVTVKLAYPNDKVERQVEPTFLDIFRPFWRHYSSDLDVLDEIKRR